MSKMDDFFWDGYLHWARKIEESRPEYEQTLFNAVAKSGETIYEPVFIRMIDTPEPEVLEAMRTVAVSGSQEGLAALSKIDNFGFLEQVVFDRTELVIALEHSLQVKVPLEFFIYREVARSRDDHHNATLPYVIIDVGAPALAETSPPYVGVTRVEKLGDGPNVIGAIIDNDIGFLNRRFCSDENHTRFAAIWLQSRERILERESEDDTDDTGTAGETEKYVHIGRVLLADDVDALHALDNRSEQSIYREINTSLHRWEAFQKAPPKQSHGTAVADVAFGADFEASDRMKEVPLLGVQLPPEAALDTSGTYSESYIVQAMRWLCHQGRLLDYDATLVINISYGVLAGQKDGGKFLEAQIAREIDLAKHYGQTVKVVYAYGNSHNSRQVAQLDLAPGQAATLSWVIHPDNPFPSFMEVRRLVDNALVTVPSTVRITLAAPMGGVSVTAQPGEGDAQPPLGPDPEMPACRVYHVPERTACPRPKNPSYYNVAIAPTRRLSKDVEPAQAGDWSVTLENTSDDEAVSLVLQIQRGDTAPGFSHGGKQSYFEGAFVDDPSSEFPAKTVVEPLTNAGTNSAYTTAHRDGICTVAALRHVLGEDIPAEYSSRGAPWSGGENANAEMVVDGLSTYGVQASGTYSGTTTRLSGTSGAAALKTQALIRDLIENGGGHGTFM